MKKEGSCINLGNEVDAWSGKTGAHASLLGSVGRAEPRKHHVPPDREPTGPNDVVLDDEGTRVSGAGHTTPSLPKALSCVRRQPSPMPEATQARRRLIRFHPGSAAIAKPGN